MTFAAYSDESAITGERFGSVSVVSLPRRLEAQVSGALEECLTSSAVSEFKWSDLNSAKRRLCASKMIDVILKHASPEALRVDVVVWDTQDARHAVRGRDDAANLERMFFHLLRTSMTRRASGNWHVFPDERLGADWATLQSCLASAGAWLRRFDYPLLRDAYSELSFRVRELTPVQSHLTPLVQAADLFAGMAAFSRKHADVFRAWSAATDPQQDIFGQPDQPHLSHRQRERFVLVPQFAERCKALRLGVSLKTNGYLKTMNPAQPLNFWHYMPQHVNDRAPLRR